MKNLRMYFILTSSFLYLIFSAICRHKPIKRNRQSASNESKLSSQTKACIGCHETYTPGIVHDWLSSRHSKVTPSDAMKNPRLNAEYPQTNFPLIYQGMLSDVMNATAGTLKNIRIILSIWVTR